MAAQRNSIQEFDGDVICRGPYGDDFGSISHLMPRYLIVPSQKVLRCIDGKESHARCIMDTNVPSMCMERDRWDPPGSVKSD